MADFGVSVGTIDRARLFAWRRMLTPNFRFQTIMKMHLINLTLLVLYHEYDAVISSIDLSLN